MTEQLVTALDSIGAEILLTLLVGPLTEAEIVGSVELLDQPTCNRRLHKLAGAGLVAREVGKPHAPHRPWKLRHAEETETLLTALLELADAVEIQNRAHREANKRRLTLARAGRLGIRVVDGS